MKKFLSLVLAAMLLMSCTAFASSLSGINMNEEYVGDAKKFKTTDSASAYNGHDSATQKTDVWLQVEASGQIDVTVPLVVVFKTNINGGEATTGSNYQITNFSSAALKVTEVKIQDVQETYVVNGEETKMEMVETIDVTEYDQYTLTVKPDDQYVVDDRMWTAPQNVKSAASATGNNDIVKFTTDPTAAQGTIVYVARAGEDAHDKGLWRIEKDPVQEADNTTGNTCKVDLALKTSELSFVTKVKAKDDANIENGVKLFTVTYTVKIDDSAAIGGDIVGVGLNTGDTYKYTGE